MSYPVVLSDYYDASGNPLPTSTVITDTSGVGASHEISIGAELPPGDMSWVWIGVGVLALFVIFAFGGGGEE